MGIDSDFFTEMKTWWTETWSTAYLFSRYWNLLISVVENFLIKIFFKCVSILSWISPQRVESNSWDRKENEFHLWFSYNSSREKSLNSRNSYSAEFNHSWFMISKTERGIYNMHSLSIENQEKIMWVWKLLCQFFAGSVTNYTNLNFLLITLGYSNILWK